MYGFARSGPYVAQWDAKRPRRHQLAIAGRRRPTSAIYHADEESRCDCNTFQIHYRRATGRHPRSSNAS